MPYKTSIRSFSLVLSCLSKRAYKWIRKSFSNRLPTLRTLRSWHSKSDIESKPGFNKKTLITLKSLAEQEKAKGKTFYVSLCFDEMAMRRHVQWIHGRKFFSGMIAHGKKDDDEIPVANFVPVFLVSSLELKCSFILGYFLIKSLSKVDKASIIKDAILEIDRTGANLITIAFDGLITNFSAFEHLGAPFNKEAFMPYILDNNNRRISLVLDPPHMLKLVRNCLHDKIHIIDGNDRDISWEFFGRLVERKNVLATHKMNRKHIEFKSNIMNVRIAAETLSLSVANSMEYFRIRGDRHFIEASGTITFIKIFNKAFDIVNAKHADSFNKFKQGFCKENANEILDFLNYLTVYIKSLKLEGIDIIKSARKTAFLGFLVNIETMKYLYHNYVATDEINRILFFYLGQDSLECLFSRLRSMLGSNDNPTAQQLSGILRQIIALQEINAPEGANCQDHLNILNVSSASNQRPTPNPMNELPSNPMTEFINVRDLINEVELSQADLYTIKFRAGAVEKKIRYGQEFCTHEACKSIFINSEDKIDGIFFESLKIQRPTKSTFEICELVYKFFKIEKTIFDFDYKVFYKKVINAIDFGNLFTSIDFTHDMKHKSLLVLVIIDEYVRIHATFLARKMTVKMHSIIMGNQSKKLKQAVGQ